MREEHLGSSVFPRSLSLSLSLSLKREKKIEHGAEGFVNIEQTSNDKKRDETEKGTGTEGTRRYIYMFISLSLSFFSFNVFPLSSISGFFVFFSVYRRRFFVCVLLGYI